MKTSIIRIWFWINIASQEVLPWSRWPRFFRILPWNTSHSKFLLFSLKKRCGIFVLKSDFPTSILLLLFFFGGYWVKILVYSFFIFNQINGQITKPFRGIQQIKAQLLLFENKFTMLNGKWVFFYVKVLRAKVSYKCWLMTSNLNVWKFVKFAYVYGWMKDF